MAILERDVGRSDEREREMNKERLAKSNLCDIIPS